MGQGCIVGLRLHKLAANGRRKAHIWYTRCLSSAANKTHRDNIKIRRTITLGNLNYPKLPKLCRLLDRMCNVCGNTWWTFARIFASLDLMCVLEVSTHDFLWVGKCRATWKVEDDLVEDPVISAGRSSGPPAALPASPVYNFPSPPLPKTYTGTSLFSGTCAKSAITVSIVLLQDHPLNTDQLLAGQIYTYYTRSA